MKTNSEERKTNNVTRVTRAALLIGVTVGLYSSFDFRSSLLSAQDPPAPRPFSTEVNYVRDDMYPTSGDMPVLDLQQSEIEVLEDGVPQKIAQSSMSPSLVCARRRDVSRRRWRRCGARFDVHARISLRTGQRGNDFRARMRD